MRGSFPPSQALGNALAAGASLDEALTQAARWIPEADRYFISAGAESGRLPAVFRRLAERHQQLARVRNTLLVAALYPLFVLHMVALVLPALAVIEPPGENSTFHFDFARYFSLVFAILVPAWTLGGGFTLLAINGHPVARRVLGVLPGASGFLKNRALSDLAAALAGFLESGVIVSRAWGAAGLVSGDTALKQAALAIATGAESGEAPSRLLRQFPQLPATFADFYTTGERTGRLEEALWQLSSQYADAAKRSLTFAVALYPTLLFLIAAALAVWQVLRFWLTYFENISKIS